MRLWQKLPKLRVAGSNPVSRSNFMNGHSHLWLWPFLVCGAVPWFGPCLLDRVFFLGRQTFDGISGVSSLVRPVKKLHPTR